MHAARIIVVIGMLVFPSLAAAQLRFTQPTAELGELRGGLPYQHRFEFVNESTQTIEITDIRLGCGCLQPVLDKRVYLPGEKGSLLMNVRTLGQMGGARAWRAHVQYRQGKKLYEAGLVVAGTVRNEITVEPSVLAMTVETTLRQEITIKDLRAATMKVTTVLGSSPVLRVSMQPTAAGVTKVIVEVDGAALKSARQEEMLNIYTDDPAYRHLQVPITLMKAQRAAVSATPERVEIVGSGAQLVRLRGVNDQPVRIEKVDADHAAVKCTFAAGPGNDATLKISVDGARLDGANVGASVRVQLGGAGGVVTIPVMMRKE